VVGIAGGGVEELAVSGEVAVVEDEGDFVFSSRQMEGVFDLVSDEVKADEAGVGAEAVEAHGVVVVPEGSGVLLVGVVADAAFARDEPVVGVAIVFGGSFGSVDVGDGADVGHVAAAAVKGVVDGKEVLCGEVVDPLDLEGMAAAGFDNGRERSGAVAPHSGGWEIAVDLGVDLAHGDAKFVRGGGAWGRFRDGEGVNESRKLEDVQHGCAGAGGVWADSFAGRQLVHVVLHSLHLSKAAAGAVDEAQSGGLLEEASAGGAGLTGI
jgi:hypothetical protein